MKPVKRLSFNAVIAVPLALAAVVWSADSKAEDRQSRPTVVELFTSQGCYSCPPAEAFLGELAGRPDLIALEFHVDYWDDLVYGSAGKWQDPYSSAMATNRQRLYAASFSTRRVYTPQMVIDGHLQGVGTRRGDILSAIDRAKVQASTEFSLQTSVSQAGNLAIEVDGPQSQAAVVWLVTFYGARTTRVLAGENKGKSLVSHNIVKEMLRLGDWPGDSATYAVPTGQLGDAEGCAVLVQPQRLGPILAAAPCPALPS